MSNHPNFDRAQAALDAIRQGDYASSFDLYADDIAWENGRGAGPWHRAEFSRTRSWQPVTAARSTPVMISRVSSGV